MKTRTITFDASAKEFILDAFKKHVGEHDYIVENTTNEPVLTQNGEPVQINEFAGIVKGSEIYIKSDLASLISYVESRKS
jgi:hypothetical protein